MPAPAGLAAGYANDLLSAADAFDHRLPELFGGFSRSDTGRPVTYPAACRPQAWSAAAPLLLLRRLLRLDPDVPAGRVHVAPLLPPGTALTVEGISLGTAGTLDLRVEGPAVEVRSAPPGIEVVGSPRPEP